MLKDQEMAERQCVLLKKATGRVKLQVTIPAEKLRLDCKKQGRDDNY